MLGEGNDLVYTPLPSPPTASVLGTLTRAGLLDQVTTEQLFVSVQDAAAYALEKLVRGPVGAGPGPGRAAPQVRIWGGRARRKRWPGNRSVDSRALWKPGNPGQAMGAEPVPDLSRCVPQELTGPKICTVWL